MDRDLGAVLEATGGVLAASDLASTGLSPMAVSRLVRTGSIARVRRGAFVGREQYERATPSERYRMRVLAVLRSRPGDAASHHAALSVARLPIWGADHDRIDLRSDVGARHQRAGLVLHPRAGLPETTIAGMPCLHLPHALVHFAATAGMEAGLVAMDAGVHAGTTTVEELRRASTEFRCPGIGKARGAITRIDPACESVGESRTRLLLQRLGLRVASQVVVSDGSFVGRVDFLVEGCVVVEFDGLLKYDGAQGREALVAEKHRESRLVAAGYEVVRLIWSDLDDPRRVAELIRLALGRARSRTR